MRKRKRVRRLAGSLRKSVRGAQRRPFYRGKPPGGWLRAARLAGESAGRLATKPAAAGAAAELAKWLQQSGLPPAAQLYRRTALAEAFRKGYSRGAGRPVPAPLLPAKGSGVTAVVSASNQANSLPGVLRELQRLGLQEIIVVVNGSNDCSFEAARSFEGVMAVNVPDTLGPYVARALGAKLSSGEAVLLVDGGSNVSAEQLGAYISAVTRGADVVLNQAQSYSQDFVKQDDGIRCQSFLNRILDREDLQAASLYDTPCLLSRRALDMIGCSALAVPPKAQGLALAGGLKVEVLGGPSSGTGGPSPAGRPDAAVILGDHLEALGELMALQGPRLKWGSMTRRELAERRNRQ